MGKKHSSAQRAWRDAALTGLGKSAPSDPNRKGKTLCRCFKPHCPDQSRKPRAGLARTHCPEQAEGTCRSFRFWKDSGTVHWQLTPNAQPTTTEIYPKMLPVSHGYPYYHKIEAQGP